MVRTGLQRELEVFRLYRKELERNQKLYAENKRLREALDKITDLEVFDGKSREHYQSLAVQAFCIACKALEGDSNV